MNNIIEANFFEKIDCNFPYFDIPYAKKLILEADKIGVNAIFGVCYELCNIPSDINVPIEYIFEIFSYLKENITFNKYSFLIEIVERYLNNEDITVEEIKSYMIRLECLGKHYAILGLLYSLDKTCSNEVEELYHDILEQWGLRN